MPATYQELVGICKWALTLRPSASADQLRTSLDVMRFWARMECKKLFPDETTIMFTMFDDTMVQAFSTTKQNLLTQSKTTNQCES